MTFDANGTFTRWGGSTVWQGDAAAGTKIMANRHDDHDQALADGLSQCLTRIGAGVPTADIPWGGKKIVNLADPTQPQDAATRSYVDTLPGWEKSKNYSGADLDGRLNFTAPSGVNGITWTYVDVSWVARHSEPSKTSNRLVMNNSVAPNTTGDAVGDVFIIDDTGRVNNSGYLSNNLSWDGSAWRAISPGIGTVMTYQNGTFGLNSNDVATITNPYAVATMRQFLSATNSNGSAVLNLIKANGTLGKINSIRGYAGTGLRWQMQLGDGGVAESSTRKGSNFILTSYDNTGPATGPFNELIINRETHTATFGGSVVSASNFDSVSPTCILSATNGGTIYLRPDGPTVTTSSFRVDTNGSAFVCDGVAAAGGGIRAGRGLQTKQGYQGSYQGNWFNAMWVSPDVRVYIDGSYIGDIYWQVASDYRIKRDVQPLPSLWSAIKALKPISYKHKAFKDIVEDDKVRWGFSAHEMQEALGDIAATGVKDDPEIVQRPDQWLLITALTRALQEAMARIEALEAAA